MKKDGGIVKKRKGATEIITERLDLSVGYVADIKTSCNYLSIPHS